MISTESERYFRTAMEVAPRRPWKILELRATTTLTRLLRDTDRRDEALTILAGNLQLVHRGFRHRRPERPKALLDELNQ